MDPHEKIQRICDLPYGAEYAKSDRSNCKKCKNKIGMGHLRISVREQSRYFDGVQDNWFHTSCFFDRFGHGGTDKINETSIRGFEILKWDDQEYLRKKIDEAENGPAALASFFVDFRSDYSKTNKGKCFACKEFFKAQELKIGRKSSWYHHKCSLATPTPVDGSPEDIRGFEDLKPEDQEMLMNIYGPVKKEAATNTDSVVPKEEAEPSCSTPSEDGAVEVKTEVKEELVDVKEEPQEEVPKKRFRFAKDPAPQQENHKEKMKKQTDIMWELREQFENLKRADMAELLKANNQIPPDNEGQMLELLVDCATFGKPSRCPRCLSGQIIFSLGTRTYTCMGYITEYTKCPFSDLNPVRAPFVIPRDMYNRLDLLKMIKVNRLSKRIYAEAQTIVDRPENKAFAYLGARNKQPVESYCEGRKEGHDAHNAHHKKIVKQGTVVDGEFGKALECHVYRDEKNGLYSTTLSFSDLVTNANSYYRMQLLKHDNHEEYYVFRSWGRVGTDIGDKKDSFFRYIDDAKEEFERIFKEKTGNRWEHRDYFEKKGGLFGLVDTDYSELETAFDDQKNSVKAGSLTTMHRAVKEIMMKISDVNTIKKALNELELDVTKMPLGKLSKQQIKKAYAVLTELTDLMDRGEAIVEKVLDCTNRFYTFLPHDFGMKSAPPLDNYGIIKEKCKMLDDLLDFEITVQLLNQGRGLLHYRDPLDVNYENLRCKMEYVEPNSDEYRLIHEYLDNTHGNTHGFKLKIVDILKVEREGEREKFHAHLGNRRLLWHGSGFGNYMGILSQGLRIAPPEAPVTGYMFGKGVYFADMVSKSANYCRVPFGGHRKNAEGLLLLCDVALGNVEEQYASTNNTKLKKGISSIKGVGQWRPQENKVQFDSEGCQVVYGQALQAPNDPTKPFQLIYNEYIVYNTDQIRMRYLVRVSG